MKFLKKTKTINAIMGEKSIGPNRRGSLLNGANIGSVILYKIWTISLYGFTPNQERIMRTTNKKYITLNIMLKRSARLLNS